MKKLIAFFIVLSSFVGTTYGQSWSVKGSVKDSSGESLIGATVEVENSMRAVVTDIDGNYDLSNIQKDAVLIFSYIGMVPQTVAVNDRTQIDIVLETNATELEDVIVIGYGTTTKRKAVGSVSSIGAEKLENSAFSNVQSALQGQVPGLIIQSSGGGVNDMPSMSIRGGGSPLYVIDGIISDVTAFSMINSEDIETISFLKDASATAVYGSQAGDGIVLVTTKSGKDGAPVVAYSGMLQINAPTTIPERLNSFEYMNMRNEASMRENGVEAYTKEQMELVGKNYLYPDNDWRDILFKDFSFSQKHNVSVSGGSGNSDYYVSVGNYTTNGLLENNLESLNRTNFRSNVNTHFENINLDLSSGLSASIQNTTEPWYKNYMTALYDTPPISLSYNPDGSLADNVGNPLIYFNKDAGYDKWRKQNLSAYLDLTWRPKSVEGLSIGAKGAYSTYNYFQRKWAVYPEQFSWDEDTATATSIGMLQKPNMSSKSGYNKSVDLEGRIAYKRTFGNHTIDALALYTQRTNFSDFVSASRLAYTSSAIDQISVGPLGGMGSDGYSAEGASAGMVFRAKYDYASKYIVEFSGRYDGNDNFAPNKRWGFFPSVSGVWIISDENFMSGLIDGGILNFLKLRGSFGETGITAGTTRFGYISTYAFTGSFYTVGDTYVNTIKEGNLVDPNNLSWYTRTSSNVGFDASFFNSKLETSFDYFFYETSGYLCSPANSYSTTLGAALPKITSDTHHRRAGYEMNIRYKERVGDWSYSIGGNAVYYNQLYEQLDTEALNVLKNPYTRQTHQLDYYTTVFQSDGLFLTNNDILSTPQFHGATVTQIGDAKYIDANGDGQIDDNDKRRFEGTNFPHLMYGVDFSVSYKKLALSGLIQGTGNYYAWLGSSFSKSTTYNTLTHYAYDNRYSVNNPDGIYPNLSGSETYNGGTNSQKSSLYFENAKYIRLKNIQLSYDIKNSLFKKADFIKSASLTISATNLFTISKILKYMDPEQTLSSVKSYESQNSIAGDGSPMYKTYSMGINIKF